MLSNAFNRFKRSVSSLYGLFDKLEKHKILVDYLKQNKQNISNAESDYLNEYLRTRVDSLLFDNVLITIYLYGNFEQFIEDLVREYVSQLKLIFKRYSELDSKISKEYVVNWKSLHGRLTFDKFSNLSETTLIKSLYSSHILDQNNIIAECFIKSGGNYRSNVIAETLKGLGIENHNEVEKYEPFKSKSNLVVIDDLVNTRNEIAHVGNISSVTSISILKDRVTGILAYAESLTSFLNDRLYALQWSKLSENNEKHIVQNFYKQVGVAEFESEKACFETGYSALVKFPKGNHPQYKSTKVSSIHIKNKIGNIVSSDYIIEDIKTLFSVKFSDAVREKSEVIFFPKS